MRSTLRARLLHLAQRLIEGKKRSLRDRYPRCEIGAGTYGDLTVMEWGEPSTLTIGAYTSIGTNVTVFLGGEHRTDWVTTFPFSVLWGSGKQFKGHPKSKGNVVIGSDVWIANEAFIMSGITIGHGAVIGARAVVTKDVPAYAIVAGNPSRTVKFRFAEPTIERLLKIEWWEWDPGRIERALPALLSKDIDAFLVAAEAGKL